MEADPVEGMARLREHWQANYPADDFLAEFERRMGLGGPQEPPGRDPGPGRVRCSSDAALATEGASMEVSGIAAKAKLAERKAIMDLIKARMSRHLQRSDDPRLTDEQQQARMILAEELGALWRTIERDAAERDGPQPGDPVEMTTEDEH